LSPVDPSGTNNIGGVIISNHRREENIAMQRYPLNLKILAELGKMAASSCLEDSKQNLLFDITCAAVSLALAL
jgi:hypothetical protein